MPLKATIITTVEPLRELVHEWRALLHASDADTLFMTPEWALVWLETTTTVDELFVIAVRDGSRLVGLAPFYVTRLRTFGNIPFRCLRVIADQNTSAEYQDIIVDRTCEDPVIHAIARTVADHGGHFSFVWVPFTDVCRGASDRFRQLFRLLGYHCKSRQFSYYTAQLPETRDAFDAALSPKQRNNIRRYKKRLSEDALRFADIARTTPPDETFRILRSLHETRWASVGESGAFNRKPAFADFIRRFANTDPGRQMLSVPTLFVDDKPIAARYGFRYNGTFYEIQTGFLPDYSGSGIVNVNLAIEDAIDAGMKAYDFLGFEGDYKRRFTANPRDGESLLAAAPGFAGSLVFAVNLWPTGRFISFGSKTSRVASDV